MTTRRLPAHERREQLLDACAVIVDTEGFAAVTIERVSDACGVSRTVVYQLFGGLDGMLDRLVDRASERAEAAFVTATDGGQQMSMRGAMTAILEAVDADPATWRMFLVAPQVGPASVADRLAAGREMIRSVNVAALDSAGARPTDPELTVRMLQAIADEIVRLRLADPGAYPAGRLAAAFAEVGRALVGADVAFDEVR